MAAINCQMHGPISRIRMVARNFGLIIRAITKKSNNQYIARVEAPEQDLRFFYDVIVNPSK